MIMIEMIMKDDIDHFVDHHHGDGDDINDNNDQNDHDNDDNVVFCTVV